MTLCLQKVLLVLQWNAPAALQILANAEREDDSPPQHILINDIGSNGFN